MMTATAIEFVKDKSAAWTSQIGDEPVKLRKRIGSTTYEVNVRFSNTSTETLEDKILRLIDREVGHAA